MQLTRTEKIVALKPDNGSAMSYAVSALAAPGQAKRAKKHPRRNLDVRPSPLDVPPTDTAPWPESWPRDRLFLLRGGFFARHLGTGAARFRKSDGDGLLAARHLLAGLAAAQCSFLL